MRYLLLLTVFGALSAGQEIRYVTPEPTHGALPANLPTQPVGPGDLLLISVYGSPELSRSARVSSEGEIRLPMLKRRIMAEGALPSTLEEEIANALKDESILVEPIVNVSVGEYHSRPISVGGAVRTPVTFQAVGPTTLLQAITRAGGLDQSAGPEILVTRPETHDGKTELVTTRVTVKALFGGTGDHSNVVLTGGEEIRVPETRPLFVVGNVKRPGAFSSSDTSDATILKAVALAEGLLPYSGKQAFVYRTAESGTRSEIAVDLTRILNRKTPDVALQPGDILYIPDNKGRRLAAATLDRILTFGSTAGATALIYTAR